MPLFGLRVRKAVASVVMTSDFVGASRHSGDSTGVAAEFFHNGGVMIYGYNSSSTTVLSELPPTSGAFTKVSPLYDILVTPSVYVFSAQL